MRRSAPPAGPRRRHLLLLQGGRTDDVQRRLYPYEKRVVRAEPQPPTPPRAA